MMAGHREHSRRLKIHAALSFGYAGPMRTSAWRISLSCRVEMSRGGALPGPNERASRSIEPRLPRRHRSGLPFGKDTPLVTTSIAPAVNATRPHAVLMAIFFSLFCASGLFGSVTVSTPFLKCASILSASTPSGTPNERWKEP
jgi:hypothetical protein